MHTRPVSFPNWKEVLARTELSPALKVACTREIIPFLRHCRVKLRDAAGPGRLIYGIVAMDYVYVLRSSSDDGLYRVYGCADAVG